MRNRHGHHHKEMHEGGLAGRDPEKSSMFPLSNARSRDLLEVTDTFGCGRRRGHLAALGLTPGTEIKVCSNLGGPLVIEVRGSRLSLGRGIASKIMVRKLGSASRCEKCEEGEICKRDAREGG